MLQILKRLTTYIFKLQEHLRLKKIQALERLINENNKNMDIRYKHQKDLLMKIIKS